MKNSKFLFILTGMGLGMTLLLSACSTPSQNTKGPTTNSSGGSQTSTANPQNTQAEESIPLTFEDYQTIHFTFDQSNLRSQAEQNLTNQLPYINKYLQNSQHTNITIEGHADERGSVQYNLALGQHRAATIRDSLVTQNISDGKIRITSFGESTPFALPDSNSLNNMAVRECQWALNRRGVTDLSSKAGMSKKPFHVPSDFTKNYNAYRVAVHVPECAQFLPSTPPKPKNMMENTENTGKTKSTVAQQ